MAEPRSSHGSEEANGRTDSVDGVTDALRAINIDPGRSAATSESQMREHVLSLIDEEIATIILPLLRELEAYRNLNEADIFTMGLEDKQQLVEQIRTVVLHAAQNMSDYPDSVDVASPAATPSMNNGTTSLGWRDVQHDRADPSRGGSGMQLAHTSTDQEMPSVFDFNSTLFNNEGINFERDFAEWWTPNPR